MATSGTFITYSVDELEFIIPTPWTVASPQVTGSLMDLLHTSEVPQLLFQKLRKVDPAVVFPPFVDVLAQGYVHFRHVNTL